MRLARVARALGIGACIALAPGTPRPAGGQEVSAGQAAPPAGLQELEAGAVVRAFTEPRGSVEGRVLDPWPAGALRIEVPGAPEPVIELPVAIIDSLSVRGHHGGMGAFVGSVAGAALGALALHGIGNLVCEAPDNDCDTGPSTAAWAGFTVGGAALGAGIGWMIGRDRPRWESLHP